MFVIQEKDVEIDLASNAQYDSEEFHSPAWRS